MLYLPNNICVCVSLFIIQEHTMHEVNVSQVKSYLGEVINPSFGMHFYF